MIRKFLTALTLLALTVAAHADIVYAYSFQGQGDFYDESGSGSLTTPTPASAGALAPMTQVTGTLMDATDKLYRLTPVVKGPVSMNNQQVLNALGHFDNLIGGPHLLSSFGIVIAAVRVRATAFYGDQMTYFRLFWCDGDQYGSGYRVEVFTPGYAAIPLHRAPITLTLTRTPCLPLSGLRGCGPHVPTWPASYGAADARH